MEYVYKTLIINGMKTFADVPAEKKELVRQLLIKAGREDLVTE